MVSVEFGLVMVMVRVDAAPALTPVVCMDVGLNDFAATAAPMTVSVGVLLGGPAAPVSVDVTPDVVLGCTPVVLLVTLTVMVHEPGAAPSAPLARLMLLDPAVAVTVPPQVLVTPGAAATCMFTSASLNATVVNGTAVGLVSVNVTVAVPFARIEATENDLLIAGLPTPSVAVAVPPVPALVEDTVPVVLV